MNARIRSSFPYFVGLAVAIALYIYAGYMDYDPRAGQLGPAVWPRMAILLMAAASLFEIVSILSGRRAATAGIAEALDHEDGEEEGPRYPWMLLGGVILVLAYAVLVPILGFIVGTFLFLAIFMYLGRYRRHAVVWGVSAAVTILCGILFLRIAYVSLPRGVAPFDLVTDLFFHLPGL
jgi:hypothetical protein